MRTKAQLEKEVSRLTEDNEILIKKYNAAIRHHREQLDALASHSFPASWYVANNSPGKPVCFGGGDGEDLAVQVYLDGDYIVGVLLTKNVDVVGGAGLVPYGYND